VNRVSVIVSAHSALFPRPLDRFTPYRCVPLQPHQHVLIQHKVYLNLPRSSGSARTTHTLSLNPYHYQYPYVSPLMFPKSHKSHDIIGIALLHPYHLPHIAYTRYRPRSIYINSIIVRRFCQDKAARHDSIELYNCEEVPNCERETSPQNKNKKNSGNLNRTSDLRATVYYMRYTPYALPAAPCRCGFIYLSKNFDSERARLDLPDYQAHRIDIRTRILI